MKTMTNEVFTFHSAIALHFITLSTQSPTGTTGNMVLEIPLPEADGAHAYDDPKQLCDDNNED